MASEPKLDKNDPAQREAGRALLLQHLEEAHGTEQALVTNLRAHIAMTPRGSYRASLERHLSETQEHERAVARRIREIGRGRGVLSAAYGVVTTAVGQALVLTKGPLDLLRGGPRGEEKLLKNARDEVVTEALEIAIYDAIEALAEALGDEPTARLAARHRADEEQMLGELRRHIPRLGQAVAQARAGKRPSFDWSETGAADTARSARRGAQRKAATTRRPRVKKTQPPTSEYDSLTASEAVGKLTEFTQGQLKATIAYERSHRKRATVIERAQALQEDEPFDGYDELTARDVAQRLTDADEATARRVREYEGRHKRRVEVLEAAQRQLSGASS
jgi:ferritin-like metal-binding protein YciE